MLGDRDLNRALLERHMLLRRRRVPVLDAVERVVGLQAQVPRDPYVALWSRVDRFNPEALSEAMADRRAVRLTLFRATLHLVSARDAVTLRPVMQPVVHRNLFSGTPFGRRIVGLDVDEVQAAGKRLLEERPRTRAELTPLLSELWPERDPDALVYAVTYLLPLVQVTPRGLWERTGPSAFTTLEHWLGQPLETATEPDELILRYLAAFGPAMPADAQIWSGLTGMREVFERLRPRLRCFRDEHGRELFDVPDAPRPDPETPAPVRFLPEYDNVVLGHKDRGRVLAPGVAQWTDVGWGTVLIDGFTAARWRLQRDKDAATVRVESFRTLGRPDKTAVFDEGGRLLRFLAPNARTQDLRITTYA